MEIRARLRQLADPGYKAFQCRLMPTVDPDTVLGVRMPVLRGLAKELRGTAEGERFLEALPHGTYDENNLHGLLICLESDPDRVLQLLERFLPYVDNWATCDLLAPKALAKKPAILLPRIKKWLQAEHLYTVRFSMTCLMRWYLDEDFLPDYPALVAAACREDYYLRMMTAWYFATALAKQWDAVIPWLTGPRLDRWTHNKTIQKAIESYRITPEQKQYLRILRRP